MGCKLQIARLAGVLRGGGGGLGVRRRAEGAEPRRAHLGSEFMSMHAAYTKNLLPQFTPHGNDLLQRRHPPYSESQLHPSIPSIPGPQAHQKGNDAGRYNLEPASPARVAHLSCWRSLRNLSAVATAAFRWARTAFLGAPEPEDRGAASCGRAGSAAWWTSGAWSCGACPTIQGVWLCGEWAWPSAGRQGEEGFNLLPGRGRRSGR